MGSDRWHPIVEDVLDVLDGRKELFRQSVGRDDLTGDERHEIIEERECSVEMREFIDRLASGDVETVIQ